MITIPQCCQAACPACDDLHTSMVNSGLLSKHVHEGADGAERRRDKMLINQLPRLILVSMFLSIVGLGYSAKVNQADVTFVAESFSGTTFDIS